MAFLNPDLSSKHLAMYSVFFLAVCKGRHGKGIIEEWLRQTYTVTRLLKLLNALQETSLASTSPLRRDDTSHVVKTRQFVQHCATSLW